MSFVSAKDLEAARQQRKEQKQLQREEIIREAKQNFEKEKKRQDLRKQRGEDLWLAPGVSERFERSPKAKKRKKQKKKDHRKGNGHKSRHEESSSSEESDQWVERCDGKSPVAEEAMESASTRTALQRDEWMQIPLAPSSLSMMKLGDKEKSEEARRKEKASLQCFEKPGQHPNELNPYWKDGGTGLPMERKEGEKKPSRIGDGGRSWIVRAYKRAVEQAKDEGRSLEEIACERWGSLENFYSILKSAGVDPKNPDLPAQSQRRRYLYSGRPRTSDIKSEDDGKEGQGRHTEQDPHQDGGWNKRDSRDRRGGRHETDKDREREEAWRSREFQSSSRCDRERDNYRDRRQFRDRDDRSRQSAGSKGFLKPAEDGDNEKSHHFAGVGGGAFGSKFYPPSSNWRKKGVKEKCEEEEVLESPRRSEEREERKVPSPVEEQSHASVPVEPVTDSQLNAIGAKILKAEMMGNEAKVKQLKAEMERLRSVKEMQASHPQTTNSSASTEHQRSREERTVVLTKTDRFGRTKPVDLPSKSYRPSPVSSTHSKKGSTLQTMIGHFGREVVGGLLDAEPRLWLKPPRENFEMQKQKVLRLSEWWKPYDWTQKLKEKS